MSRFIVQKNRNCITDAVFSGSPNLAGQCYSIVNTVIDD